MVCTYSLKKEIDVLILIFRKFILDENIAHIIKLYLTNNKEM